MLSPEHGDARVGDCEAENARKLTSEVASPDLRRHRDLDTYDRGLHTIPTAIAPDRP